jgi:nitroreductase
VANSVLETIRKRRSITRFESTTVSDEQLQKILEAGRWAPSWLNEQPWRFILIKDKEIKEKISDLAPTIYRLGIKEAPICIAICVDPKEEPHHFVEDGAAATQNMALAAYSLGLGSSWIGIFNLKNEKDSAENKIKEILNIPKNWRIISIMPIGVPKYSEEKGRKKISDLVFYNSVK